MCLFVGIEWDQVGGHSFLSSGTNRQRYQELLEHSLEEEAPEQDRSLRHGGPSIAGR